MTIRSKSAFVRGYRAYHGLCPCRRLAQGSDADTGTGKRHHRDCTAHRNSGLQDVPISVTVLNDKALANNNITSAKDIATFTPSLVKQQPLRLGQHHLHHSRLHPGNSAPRQTVGTYFADVVAPRGFGRNAGRRRCRPGRLVRTLPTFRSSMARRVRCSAATRPAGAVLLVPAQADRQAGRLCRSRHWQTMACIAARSSPNIPLADTFKVRLGVDRMKRDGFQKNAGRIGFRPQW